MFICKMVQYFFVQFDSIYKHMASIIIAHLIDSISLFISIFLFNNSKLYVVDRKMEKIFV